jgi:hypothetical protein
MSLKIDEEELYADRPIEKTELFNRSRHIRGCIAKLNLIFESKIQ